MKKRIVLLGMALVLSLSLSLPASATEADTGSIEGSIINGTDYGSSVVGLEVILTAYLGTNEEETFTSVTDTEGRFIFNGLSIGSGYIFQAKVNFQGAEYYSQAISLDSEDAEQSVEITVFDSTASDESISVITSHTIVRPGQDDIQVTEYFLFANNSNRTFIGSGNTSGNGKIETLKLPLAEGATALTYINGLMDCCVLASEDGLIDTMPVKPGMYEVVYTYELPYNTSGYVLSRSVDYPITNYDLLVEYSGEVEIIGNTLTIDEPYHMEGIHFSHIRGQELAKGQDLNVLFPELVNTAYNVNTIWLILILVLIIAGLGIAYFIRKRRVQPVEVEKSTEYRRQTLLTEIARLDDDFANGSIDEETYRVIRATAKERLVELMQSSEKRSDRK